MHEPGLSEKLESDYRITKRRIQPT